MTGTNAFTDADLVAFIGEQWTPLVLQEYFAKSVAANHFVDLAEIGERTGSDIFHVPDVYSNSFSTQTQSTEGAEVTLGSPTQNDVTLDVNNHIVDVIVKLGELLETLKRAISSQARLFGKVQRPALYNTAAV